MILYYLYRYMGDGWWLVAGAAGWWLLLLLLLPPPASATGTTLGRRRIQPLTMAKPDIVAPRGVVDLATILSPGKNVAAERDDDDSDDEPESSMDSEEEEEEEEYEVEEVRVCSLPH
jgi:hypothetical protein